MTALPDAPRRARRSRPPAPRRLLVALALALAGAPLGCLDTGLGAGTLGGLAVGPDDRLYVIDVAGRRVLRLGLDG